MERCDLLAILGDGAVKQRESEQLRTRACEFGWTDQPVPPLEVVVVVVVVLVLVLVLVLVVLRL